MVMDFPLIYCNGSSVSDERYHPSLIDKTYANFVANHCHGFVINNALVASCNRRIIRTTAHDMLQQRQLNPSQQIIALIQFTVPVRTEVWVDNITAKAESESNFIQVQFAHRSDWKDYFLKNGKFDIDSGPVDKYNLSKKYWNKLTDGLAYFHNRYAEYINLHCDLIMLSTLLKSLNIDFVFFTDGQVQKFQSDYLLEFFQSEIQQNKSYIDFESFGFCTWCAEQNYTPFDSEPDPHISHYGPDAHEAFAKQIIIPKLQELNII
jgi:hypothetical protein